MTPYASKHFICAFYPLPSLRPSSTAMKSSLGLVMSLTCMLVVARERVPAPDLPNTGPARPWFPRVVGTITNEMLRIDPDLDLDNHSDEDEHDHDHGERYVPPDDLWCVSVTAKLSKIVHVDEGVHVTCAQACGAPVQTREINSQMSFGPSRPSITSYWCFHSVLLCFNATGFHVGAVDLSPARKPINYRYYYGIGRAVADLTLGIMADRDAQAQSNAEKFFQRSIVAMFSTTPVPANQVPLEKATQAASGNGKGKEKVKKQCMCLLDVLAPKILSTVQPDMPDESQMTLERARTYLDDGILPFSACELDKIRRLFEVDGWQLRESYKSGASSSREPGAKPFLCGRDEAVCPDRSQADPIRG